MTKFFFCMNTDITVEQALEKAKLLQIDAEGLYFTSIKRFEELFSDQGRLMHHELQK